MLVLGGQADDDAHQATLGDLYKFNFGGLVVTVTAVTYVTHGTVYGGLGELGFVSSLPELFFGKGSPCE